MKQESNPYMSENDVVIPEMGGGTLTIGAEGGGGTVVVGLGAGEWTVTTVVAVCAERYSVNKLCNCENPTPKTL